MTDLEYRCIHGHDKCAEMYPGPECPYCERIYAAPFVKVGEIFEALCADAEDRPKFCASMGLNFEKIIGDALAAFAARAVAAERERCLRIIREELAAARVGSVRGSIASIAAAIHRGE